MPPVRRKPKETEPTYRWTAGGVPGISHQGLIAYGGYGEVHKVGALVRGMTNPI
jgi:hypothetical protein